MDEEIKVQLGVKLWPGGEVQLRQIGLGLTPLVLINIDPIAEDTVEIHLDASSFDRIEEVHEMFKVITEGLGELAAGNTEHTMTLGDE